MTEKLKLKSNEPELTNSSNTNYAKIATYFGRAVVLSCVAAVSVLGYALGVRNNSNEQVSGLQQQLQNYSSEMSDASSASAVSISNLEDAINSLNDSQKKNIADLTNSYQKKLDASENAYAANLEEQKKSSAAALKKSQDELAKQTKKTKDLAAKLNNNNVYGGSSPNGPMIFPVNGGYVVTDTESDKKGTGRSDLSCFTGGGVIPGSYNTADMLKAGWGGIYRSVDENGNEVYHQDGPISRLGTGVGVTARGPTRLLRDATGKVPIVGTLSSYLDGAWGGLTSIPGDLIIGADGIVRGEKSKTKLTAEQLDKIGNKCNYMNGSNPANREASFLNLIGGGVRAWAASGDGSSDGNRAFRRGNKQKSKGIGGGSTNGGEFNSR